MKVKNYLMELILAVVRKMKVNKKRYRSICLLQWCWPIAVYFVDGLSQLHFLIHDFINVTKAFATDITRIRYDL